LLTSSLPFLDASASPKTWVVFSHPNHELAIYGLLQRLQPNLIYLTDGGGPDRVDQTREGLGAIGLEKCAHFLNYTEQSFYDALVQVDADFFRKVAQGVSDHLRGTPGQVFCDAVEFYNPVHDLSLPITVSALKQKSSVPIFEVPLIHQCGEEPDLYRIQRAPRSREAIQCLTKLDAAELAAKRHAREEIYGLLRAQLGAPLSNLSDAELSIESLVPAEMARAYRADDCILRYERRARLLRESGVIANEILHEKNFVPIARALTGS